MQTSDILRAWKHILVGQAPSLSIEITRECPLRCPGCYAYEPAHLNSDTGLRDLSDFRGEELVRGVLEVVDRARPLHLSLVGGDPLVRYRELEILLPQLMERGIHVQVVTSAFRAIPPEWKTWKYLTTAVSIDGLPAEHDVRRTPATYERILKNIQGGRITIHCTITGQIMHRPGYLNEFLKFWNPRPEIERIWFSFFTPQRGQFSPEVLSPEQRESAVRQLFALRADYSKLDMPELLLREFLHPPASPADCIFARTTETISADLKTRVTPCQFGGDPDCSQCGCIASMGLAAVGNYKLAGVLPVGFLFKASAAIGERISGKTPASSQPRGPVLTVLR
ncbi:MAG: radical SAM protein [Bryobacteraceae bacterium]|nr:radical SAM protein [Bryobacteraceae bacterium]